MGYRAKYSSHTTGYRMYFRLVHIMIIETRSCTRVISLMVSPGGARWYLFNTLIDDVISLARVVAGYREILIDPARE